MTETNCLEGMQCPKCESEGPFRINMRAMVLMTETGVTEILGGFGYSKYSICECHKCNFERTVKDFLPQETAATTRENAISEEGNSPATKHEANFKGKKTTVPSATPEKSGLKWEKRYYVTAAVCRMLRRGRVSKDGAIDLLHTRAKLDSKLAKAVVEMWINNPPVKWPGELQAGC